MRDLWQRRTVLRFLVVGGTNTIVTAALIVVLGLYMPGWAAFTISFALGIVFSVVMTGRVVFQSHLTPTRAVLYTVAYVLIYCCGLGAVQLLALWGAPQVLDALTVLVTAPLSYTAGRIIFTNTVRKVES